MFVAAHWVELHDADGSVYWYNQVTCRTRSTAPMPPKKLPLDDEGSFLFIEDDDDRVMPSARSVRDAGKL